MLISELGEFGLIDRIARLIAVDKREVVVGIGDDVAVLRWTEDRHLLATCDIQVAGVHFLWEKMAPYQLGRKVVAINVSDIAAMGGLPKHLLVSLVLTPDITVGYVDELYEGLREEAARAGANIVGGNMAKSPSQLMIDLFLLGEVEPERLLLRSGAQVGDSVLVTGQLGASGAGLALLLDPSLDDGSPRFQALKEAHLTPTPRLAEGRAISESGLATAMIDVSDGLTSDIAHICERSRVGVELWASALPLPEEAEELGAKCGKDPLQWALRGGEDYELLFTAPKQQAEALAQRVKEETGTPVSIIGRVVPPEEGMALREEDGRRVPLERGGWDHFRP